MKVEELVCDNCGKKAKGDEHHFRLPKGWSVVGFHSQSFVAYDDWRVTHHFCSAECMNTIMDVTINPKPKEKE